MKRKKKAKGKNAAAWFYGTSFNGGGDALMSKAELTAVAPTHDPQEAARANFSNYVQAVAFQVTLSRGMIHMLGYVRDHKPPKWKTAGQRVEANRYDDAQTLLPSRVNSHFVPYVDRLIKRGLVYHDYPTLQPGQYHPISGHRYYKLTRAGELMCDLLVEAGLLAEAK